MDSITRLVHNTGRVPLLSDASLVDAIRRARLSKLRRRLLAESVHRAWLFGRTNPWLENSGLPSAWATAGLSQESIDQLHAWSASQARERTFEPPRLGRTDDQPEWLPGLARLLDVWRYADGFIVVVADEPELAKASALPFRLHVTDYGSGSSHSCGGAFNQDCGADFSHALEAAADLARRRGLLGERQSLVLQLGHLDGPCGTPVSGRSAGLPLLLALELRHRGLSTPVFAWGASGVLDPARAGLADPVAGDSYDRKAELMTAMGVQSMILPGTGSGRWQPGSVLAPLIESWVESLRQHAGIAQDRRRELAGAVARWREDMSYGYVDPARIEVHASRLLAGDLATTDPRLAQVRAEALLALATAQNHLGKPVEAQQSLAGALEGMRQLPAELGGETLVRQAVVLQDLGDYEAAEQACRDARDQARPAGSGAISPTLELKIVGTLGQVLTCAALDNGTESAASGLAALHEAHARALEIDSARSSHEDRPEAPRNAVYLYWWHALHAPAQAIESWDQAHRAAGMDTNASTMDHLRRNRWLAVYRHLLLFNSPPHWISDVAEDQLTGDSWIRGTSLKYRATLRAWQGRTDEAERDFTEAVMILTGPDRRGKVAPLLCFFAATAALQAAQSFIGRAGQPCPRWTDEARGIFVDIPGVESWFPRRSFNGQAWLRRLDAPALGGNAPPPNPQLTYPY